MFSAVRNSPDPLFEEIPVGNGLAPSLADATIDLISEVQGGYNVLNLTNSKINAHALMILGYVSSLSIFTGPLLIKRGIQDIKISNILQDTLGLIIGVTRTTTGVLQSSGGIASTGMTLASLIFFATTIQTAMSAAQIFSFIGGCFFSAAGLGTMFLGFVEFYLCFQCNQTIKNGGNKPEEILQTIRLACKDPVQKRLMIRVLGRELMQKILNSKANEELVSEIESHIRQNLIRGFISSLLSAFASVFAVLSLVLTGVIAQYAFAVTTLIMGVLWITMDIQEFLSCYSNNVVDNQEKFLIIMNMIFCITILAASLALCTHPGILLLILTTGMILVSIHLLSIYKTCFA